MLKIINYIYTFGLACFLVRTKTQGIYELNIYWDGANPQQANAGTAIVLRHSTMYSIVVQYFYHKGATLGAITMY